MEYVGKSDVVLVKFLNYSNSNKYGDGLVLCRHQTLK